MKFIPKIIDTINASNVNAKFTFGTAVISSSSAVITLLLICITIVILIIKKREQRKHLALNRNRSTMKQTEENGGQSISLTENESYGVFKATNASSDPVTNVSMTENKSYGLFHKTEEPEYI